MRSLIAFVLVSSLALAQNASQRSVANSLNTIKNASYCADTSVSANTITCSVAVGFTGYLAGQAIDVLLANSATGATTINVNGKGAVAVTYNGNTTMATGIMASGGTYRLQYVLGTNSFVLQGAVGGGSSSGGGGVVTYSREMVTPLAAGTVFLPIGGGAVPSATEADVEMAAAADATVANLYVNLSAPPGMGNTLAFTWRASGADTSLTCSISGAVATSCNDTSNSFSVTAGDLLSISVVGTGGALAFAGSVQADTQFGTVGSNGTVNSGTANQTAYYAAGGTAVSGGGPGTAGQVWTSQGSGSPPVMLGALHVITFVIDGAGSAIATGDQGVFPTVRFACTIIRATIAADTTGSITVDIWKANAAIPTAGDIISAAAPVTLSAAQLNQNSSLSGWTTAVAVDDVFGFSVASASTVTRVIGQIWCQ